jgi:hypothetical protein
MLWGGLGGDVGGEVGSGLGVLVGKCMVGVHCKAGDVVGGIGFGVPGRFEVVWVDEMKWGDVNFATHLVTLRAPAGDRIPESAYNCLVVIRDAMWSSIIPRIR